MKKVLILTAHRRDRSPGQRFRFEQYLEYLNENGFECTVSYLISEKDDPIFYSKGKYLQKLFIFIKSVAIRFRDLFMANRYQIIFIFREAFFLGTTFFEFLFSKSKAKLIFDFDDSIWLQQETNRSANKNLFWLKNPNKTGTIISYCDLVFAGNEYLLKYASKYNSNVVIIPTTIDTKEYSISKQTSAKKTVCIGWSGSITTIDHFVFIIPALSILKEKYGERVSFKVIGDRHYENKLLGIKGIGWNKNDEIKELSEFDIGIMPLPDDEWAKGKCGLKGLQYMALNIPTIMSPVGVNTEIIQHGVNGFLASTINEWVDAISILIENPELREKIGNAGRSTVVERYSVEAQQSNYLKYFNKLTS